MTLIKKTWPILFFNNLTLPEPNLRR